MSRNLLEELQKSKTHPLKNFFKSKKITHHKLAVLCKCSISSIAAYMNGYRTPPPEIERTLQVLKKEVIKIEKAST